jgi:predicted PurR-regulated permease PerM
MPGAVLGVGSSLVVAWFQTGGDLSFIAWVGLVFAVGQTLESMFLTPVLIGDRIGLHPVVVIFALLAGGTVSGFYRRFVGIARCGRYFGFL